VTVRPPDATTVPNWVFLDGTRRVEANLFIEDSDTNRIFPVVIGSAAVGAVQTGQQVRILTESFQVSHLMVAAHGAPSGFEPLTLQFGAQSRLYEYVVPHQAPMLGRPTSQELTATLQDKMRRMEGSLAAQIQAWPTPPEVLCIDGPLSYDTDTGESIGLIKRQSTQYLSGDHERIFADLSPGNRTPLFRIHGQQNKLGRFSWFCRLMERRGAMGMLSGIMRCEVNESIGVRRAMILANMTAQWLHHFGSTTGSDPRAPQNLYPIGALEHSLKHYLGDSLLIARSLSLSLDARL